MTSEIYDENLGNSDSTITELNASLLKYGLTPNQAKVYLYLSKIGVRTASEISKSTDIPRTETYRLLDNLQEKGILYSIFGKPTKFKALKIDDSIKNLVNNEKARINELETGAEDIIKLWNSITKYAETTEKIEENKFQTLQGNNSILVKLEQMIKESNENISVLGTELDFKKFYHTDFIKLLRKTKSDLRILSDYDTKRPHIFENVPSKKIKIIEDINREDFCFIIKDNSQVIFFINNPELKDRQAIWTDSKAFIVTLSSLFNLLWAKSPYADKSDDDSVESENTFEHRLREIEQEKIIVNYLQTTFKLTESDSSEKKDKKNSKSHLRKFEGY